MLFVATVIFSMSIQVKAQNSSDDIIIGRKVKMQSNILEKEIQLSIHIPDGYADSAERYPVLYIFQTHFEQVSGAVKNLYDYNLTPKIIVVSIDGYEFGYLTPTKIERDPNSGQADKFLQFFKDELFPFMDLNYRTRPYRLVFSNSWGAMFGAYAVLAKPDVFNAAIASIPWIMYDNENQFILKNTELFLNKGKYNNFLYMTMDNELELLSHLEPFIDILKNNPQQGLEWQYNHWPEEDHTSTPYRSIYSGLGALFADWTRVPKEIADKGLDEIKKHEINLNNKFGYEIGISTTALRLAGQEFKQKENYEEAVAIYKYAIEKNPENAFAYVTLGRAYEENNQLELAKKAFDKGYEIAVSTSHPQVKWVKNFVDGINKKIESVNK